MTDTRNQLQRRQGIGAVVALLGIVGTLYGGIGLFATAGAWGYTNAETTTVTVGRSCEVTISRRGGGGTDCPATWTADGKTVSGTLTTKNGGRLPESGSDTIRAKVYGDTARTSLDSSQRIWGLSAPFVLVVGLVLLLVGRRADTRASKQLATLGPAPVEPGSRTSGGAATRETTRTKLADAEMSRLADEHQLGAARTIAEVPLGLRGPLMFLVAVVVLVVLLSGVLRWIVLGVGLLGLGLLGYATWVALRDRTRTAFFDEGVVDRHQGKVVALRYDELDAAWSEVGPLGRRYRVRGRDGAEVVIDGNRTGHALTGERLLQEASVSAVPRLQHQVSVGGVAYFGPVEVTQTGLVVEGAQVPWSQVQGVTLEAGGSLNDPQQVVVGWADRRWSVSEDQVPWARTLVPLVAGLKPTV